MEGMPHSLFLDPFQEPSAASDANASGPNASGSEGPSDGIEVVPGEVVDSAAASERADRTVAVATPLDLVDAVGAFLEDTHLWWPRDLKATERDGHVFFAEGQLTEEGIEGQIHRWGTVQDATDAALELDWFGREPAGPGAAAAAVPGAVPAASQGSRVVLSWSAGASGGAELSARGTGSAPWREEWTALLGAFARFTGGHALSAPGDEEQS